MGVLDQKVKLEGDQLAPLSSFQMRKDKTSTGTLPLPTLPRYLVEATGLFKGDGVK